MEKFWRTTIAKVLQGGREEWRRQSEDGGGIAQEAAQHAKHSGMTLTKSNTDS